MNRQKKKRTKVGKRVLGVFLAGVITTLGSPAGIGGCETPKCCYAAEVPDVNTYEEMVHEIVRVTNEERAKYGLPALKWDADMEIAANVRAAEQQSVFSHTRPDGSCCFTVFSQFGIPGNYRGENLAYGRICSAKKVMDAWMNSEGHKMNILNGRFTRIGVGYAENGTTGYWCQLFAN